MLLVALAKVLGVARPEDGCEDRVRSLAATLSRRATLAGRATEKMPHRQSTPTQGSNLFLFNRYSFSLKVRWKEWPAGPHGLAVAPTLKQRSPAPRGRPHRSGES